MLRVIFFNVARSNVRRLPVTARRLAFIQPASTIRFQSNTHRDPSLQANWVAPIVSYEEVKKRSLNPTEDFYLIDVREPDEVVQGSIPSAVSIPLSGITKSLSLDSGEFLQTHGFNKPELDQEIIFYCRSGKRSASACDVARRNGYKNVKNYEGSWLDWVQRQEERRTTTSSTEKK